MRQLASSLVSEVQVISAQVVSTVTQMRQTTEQADKVQLLVTKAKTEVEQSLQEQQKATEKIVIENPKTHEQVNNYL